MWGPSRSEQTEGKKVGIASPGPTKPWQPLELHTGNPSSPKGAQKGAHIHYLLSSSPQPWRSERGDPLTEKKPGPKEGLDRAKTGTWESPVMRSDHF